MIGAGSRAELVADLAARLELREPNRQALAALADAVAGAPDDPGSGAPLEVVIASATGVGKTYVLAAAVELLATAHGVRDIVIIAPGRTILDKTRDNFTPGHPRSLLGPLTVDPVLITADTFTTATARAAMADPECLRLYLFTVQSVLRPAGGRARRVHTFQEGLGGGLLARLSSGRSLVVIADEHHCYAGPAFAESIRRLRPWVLIGLTATPGRHTPDEQIIFRYPLARAIADRLVKIPVLVGRTDEGADATTRLGDGVTLLAAKASAMARYAAATGLPPVNPVMLVVAADTAEADEYGRVLRSRRFFDGRYADAVLVVHSRTPETALGALAGIEDPDSPVRIVVAVGMLKEGWDVRNVYVIAAMRASVSTVLTEQTLGRGMRLPFGRHTGVHLLDTLEILAHERYQDLLSRAGVLARALGGPDRPGSGPPGGSAGSPPPEQPPPERPAPEPPVVALPGRVAGLHAAARRLSAPVTARVGVLPVEVPVLRLAAVSAPFSLAELTDAEPFRLLGAALAAEPPPTLRRAVIGPPPAIGGPATLTPAAHLPLPAPRTEPLARLRTRLTTLVLAAPSVPSRACERAALQPLLDALLAGLGRHARAVLTARPAEAAARLTALVEREQRRTMAAPRTHDLVSITTFAPARLTDRPLTRPGSTPFEASVGYTGWRRALFTVEWFGSAREHHTAVLLDADPQVHCWTRPQPGELPALWPGAPAAEPTFLILRTDGTRHLLQLTGDPDDPHRLTDAARRWTERVNSAPHTRQRWLYQVR